MAGVDSTRFLNVDLELVAAFGLEPLVTHLGENVLILRDSVDETTRTVWLELSAEPIDVDDAVRRYVTMIEALPTGLRKLWDGCTDRCLNVGIQAARTPHAAVFSLTEFAVAGAARIAARIEVTVYGEESSNQVPDSQ
jgi:hypothetical protein